jgi:capsular polysaccharide transport system permease protein
VTAPSSGSDDSKPGALARTHAAAIERAALAAQEWRRSARALRQVHNKTVSRLSWDTFRRAGYHIAGSIRRSRLGIFGFLVFFCIPAFLSVAYFSFIASSQYVSEARFALRGGEPSPLDSASNAGIGGLMAGLGSYTQLQDTLIVVNYVTSQAMVEALDREVGLREMFGRSGIDWLSRFDADGPIEDLVTYWKWWHVRANIETSSGIITVRVSAFTPEDALKIGNAIVNLSEKLVNELSNRSRQDAVKIAEAELKRAEKRLINARLKMRDLRNQQETLDPQRTAEGLNKLISELRLEKIYLEQELTASERNNVSSTAPQNQILRKRIQVVGEQMASLEQMLTSQDHPERRTIADKITRFEDLELEKQIAENQYTAAASALETARVNAEEQKVYLATFVDPLLPADSTWPYRITFSLLGVAAAAILYASMSALWGALYRKLHHHAAG